MSYFTNLLHARVSIESENEDQTPIEDAVQLDDSATPEEGGTSLDPRDDVRSDEEDFSEDTEEQGEEEAADDESGEAEKTPSEDSDAGEEDGDAGDVEGEMSDDDGEMPEDLGSDEASEEPTDDNNNNNDDVPELDTDTDVDAETSDDDDEEEESDDKEEAEKEEEPTEEEVEKAEEALESLRATLVKAYHVGGLTEASSNMVKTSLETIMTPKIAKVCQRDTIVTQSIPSLESFSTTSSRRALATSNIIDTVDYYLHNLRNR